MTEKANLKFRVRARFRARVLVRVRVRVRVRVSARVRVSEHRDAENEPEEDEVGQALGEHRGGEAHLGDEGVGELDDLEQLDAHAEREVDLVRVKVRVRVRVRVRDRVRVKADPNPSHCSRLLAVSRSAPCLPPTLGCTRLSVALRSVSTPCDGLVRWSTAPAVR